MLNAEFDIELLRYFKAGYESVEFLKLRAMPGLFCYSNWAICSEFEPVVARPA